MISVIMPTFLFPLPCIETLRSLALYSLQGLLLRCYTADCTVIGCCPGHSSVLGQWQCLVQYADGAVCLQLHFLQQHI